MQPKQKITGLFLCLITVFTFNKTQAQTEIYNTIQLITQTNQYTVTAAFDTTYAKEVIITMADTVGFQNMNATLSLQTESGWETTQTVLLTKPLTKNACTTPLCIYRRNEQEWVLFLGSFSLLTRHKIELQFNSLFTNTTNTFWENEF